MLKHKQLHRRNNLVPGSVRNLSENDSPTRTGENGNTELTLFNLNCIAAATDNFSDSNKLGQGGFGVVYKVFLFFLCFGCLTVSIRIYLIGFKF